MSKALESTQNHWRKKIPQSKNLISIYSSSAPWSKEVLVPTSPHKQIYLVHRLQHNFLLRTQWQTIALINKPLQAFIYLFTWFLHSRHGFATKGRPNKAIWPVPSTAVFTAVHAVRLYWCYKHLSQAYQGFYYHYYHYYQSEFFLCYI